jgi:hypothetical protein
MAMQNGRATKADWRVVNSFQNPPTAHQKSTKQQPANMSDKQAAFHGHLGLKRHIARSKLILKSAKQHAQGLTVAMGVH